MHPGHHRNAAESADGDLNLLPAIPHVWQGGGSVSGLRARGGFELVNMQWKDEKVTKVVIRSTLGGNLRLRVPNAVKLSSGAALKKASGENSNEFYAVEKTSDPIIAKSAVITPPDVKDTVVYDVPTQRGQVITFVAQ